MKRICLVVVGIFIQLFGALAQVKDSSAYQSRKLKLEEINFVSSYYTQDGSNSAVTGGVGTEKLADYSNNFEVKYIKAGKHGRKVQLDMNLGVDYYTSASSDRIDPNTISSASSRDLRIYPSFSRKVINEVKGSSFSTHLSYSHESDYRSYGFGAGISKMSPNRNRELTVRAQLYIDWVKMILPIELRDASTGGVTGAPNQYDYPWSSRKTFSTSFSFSQVLNQRLQLSWLLDLTYQHGFLGLPFHRVYLKDNLLRTETLPSSRYKIPLGIRASYFLGDQIILRPLYRFYKDDWGLNAHTAELETVFKITPFVSVSPFYRYYRQTAIDFFAPYLQHDQTDIYYSSNYDLSAFHSQFFGTGFRWAPPKGLFGLKRWSAVEIRYGHYKRSNGLSADIISLQLKYK